MHHLLGYERYLEIFSIFKISTLRLDKRKSDFLYFNTLMDEKANIIVIGACTGITTIPLAKDKSKRKIFAYEPLSSNYSVLDKVVNRYKLLNIRTFNLGLADKSDQKEMILPVINGVKKQGMAHVKDSTILLNNEGLSEFVKFDCLDNRPELNKIKIAGIKVVAENFEFQVFEGAKKIIQNSRPIIYCELWANEKRKQVLELIMKYNYDVFYRKHNELMPYNKDAYSGKNFFFKPKYE